MSYTGQVNASIYYGTLFDDVNVPFDVKLIRQSAHKTKHFNGTAVWQSTWLGSIDVNVDDYQDIVGAQFVEIHETGAADYGEHWYNVRNYEQISQKCARLTIEYNPLLSIGINNIQGISGTLRRWTVNQDTPWRYTASAEPLDANEPYRYEYQLISTPTFFDEIISANCDLSVPITTRKLGDGEIPIVDTVQTPGTMFAPSGETVPIQGGLAYYDNSTNFRQKISTLIGAGYDTQSLIRLVPHDMCTFVKDDSGKYTQIRGVQQSYPVSLSKKETNYMNAKAGEIGITFTLSNIVTGDAVSVPNYLIASSPFVVVVNTDPLTGYIASFSGYMSAPPYASLLGGVKSSAFPLVPFQSSIAQGVISGQQTLFYNSQIATKSLEYLQNSQDLGRWENFYRSLTQGIQSISNATQTGAKMGGIWGALGAGIGSTVAQFPKVALESERYFLDTNHAISVSEMSRNALLDAGSISLHRPADVKYSDSAGTFADSFRFYVQKETLSNYDRQKADVFFNKYGYNVNGIPFNDSAMLNSRAMYTYVLADDVRIVSAYSTNQLTRFQDIQTINWIRERFKNGIRIWQIPPTHNYNQNNPPVYDAGAATDDNPSPGNPEDSGPINPPTQQGNRQLIVLLARNEIGVAESPLGSNNVKYNTEYYNRQVSGDKYPWCAVFVWWLFQNTNLSYMYYNGAKTASCTTLLNYYRTKNQLVQYSHAKPGDLVFFNWDGDTSTANHIGVLYQKNSDGSFVTIEGNTDTNNVKSVKRSQTKVLAYANPYGD